MTIRLDVLTPIVDGAPGRSTVGRVQIHNDGVDDVTCTIGIVGLASNQPDDSTPSRPIVVVVPTGSSLTCEVPVHVPSTLGVGQHAAAFEVISDTPGDRAALTPFTLAIASVARVELTPTPSTIRARRRASFHLDIANHEDQPVDIVLEGESPDVEVRFEPDRFRLLPGQRAVATGRIKGPRLLTGETTQHNILVAARGRSATTSVNAAYVQRPLFAHRLRGLLAAVTVIALWLGAIGGVALWWSGRDDGTTADAAQVTGVDTNGDGIPDAFFDADGNPVTAVDTNGDGIPDSFLDADGNPIPGTDTDGDGIPDTVVGPDGKPLVAIDTDGDGVPDALSDGSTSSAGGATAGSGEMADAGPRSTVVRGTVEAGGDPSNVSITLAPIELGAPPDPRAAPMGFASAAESRSASGPSAKIWSARFGRVDSSSTVRQSQAIAPIVRSPEADGVWLFTDVALRQTYEIVFAKPGFDTQSFVVAPPADGSPVDLDVDLEPARGALSGIVTGPSGPLGGVAITITDGTLSFETTSATDGKIGTWSLDGVSTPSVYSITATLRGYGTEVRQIELQPGDRRNDVNLALKPGVGSIGGRVADATGAPLGGVTVTATNGDESRTTSTLTDGDIGAYSLPQLTVPGTWTVTVERSGFVTQTRRLPIGGSLANVDFVMISESLRLRGRITSSAGGGIVNAGLTLSTGDLTFKVSTAAAPDAGAFSIDNLPPGNYTVTAEHFRHETATEFITLTAGVDPPPLDMTLTATAGPPPVGNGSLVVSVLDADPLANPQGIEDATVTLVLTRTGEIVRTVNDASSSNVRIDKIPVGTYTLLVSAPSFNNSVPSQVSIGLQEERREVRLQQLGQAGGKVIDAITRKVLTGYAVTVVQERAGGDFQIGRYPDIDGVWQTQPNALSNGTYRVEFQPGDEPVGYKVRNDQKLDSSLADGIVMRFVVRDGKTKTQVVINDIEADPYPVVTGRVSKPVLGPTTTFVPIDDPNLTVGAVCNGNAVTVRLLDTTGLSDPGKTLYDEFSIDGLALAAAVPSTALPTTCALTMSSPGAADATFTLLDVDAADAGVRGDRRVSAALTATPQPELSGMAFWYDGPRRNPPDRIALADVVISASGFITGFSTVEGTAPDGTPDPTVNTGAATTTSNAAGSWTIAAPAFGVTAYTFSRDGFQNGTMPITVDGAPPAVGPGSGSGLAAIREGASFAVELLPPDPGVLNGRIAIVTSRSQRAYDQVTITATDPFGNVLVSGPGTRDFPAPDQNGNFTIAPAAAGTWSVTFTPPDNHAFFGSSATVTKRIEPGATAAGFDTTLVELATVTTRLHDKSAPGVIVTTVDAGISLTGADTRSRPLGDLPADGRFVIDRLAVAASTPDVSPASYQMAVDVPGYAVRTADVTVDGNPTGRPGTSNIPFGALAGQDVTVDVFLQPLGRRVGSILGNNGAGRPTEQLSLAPAGRAVVTAARVQADGSPLPPGDPGLSDPGPTVTPGPGAGEFTLVGSAGYYLLTVSHPEYEAPAGAGIPADTATPGGVAGVFQVADGDTTAIGTYTLDIIKGDVNIRAVDSIATGNDVAGATYRIFPKVGVCTGTPPPDAVVDDIPADGNGGDVALVPGVYCLQINRFDSNGTAISFPAITTVTVTRAVGGAASRTTVLAPLPALVASVTGRIVARNTLDPARPVELPATPITMTSSFGEPNEILNGSTAVANENPDTGDRSALATPTVPADLSSTYTFVDVPAGSTTITAPDLSALGYTLVTPPQTIAVTAPGPFNGPVFVYTVASAPVRIPIGPAGQEFPDLADVRLTSPSSAVYTQYTFDQVGPATFDFSNVAPEAGTWTLSFTDALHVDVNATFTIPLALTGCADVPADCHRTAPVVATTADAARLTGTVLQRATEIGTPQPLAPDATMVLASKTVPGRTYLLTGPQSPYRFDVPPDTYSLTIASPGYITTTVNTIDLRGAAGTVTTQNRTIDKAVTISVVYDNTRPPAIPGTLKIQLLPGPIAPKSGSTTEFPPLPAGTYQVQIVDTAITDPYPTYTGDAVTYGIGESATVHVLLPRLIGITVSGVAPGVATTVTVTNSGTYTRSITALTPSFDFSSADPTTPLPAAGQLSIEVSAPGYRTQVFSAGEFLQFKQSVTLRRNVTVSGAIAAPDGSFVVTAPGGNTATATITSGRYAVVLGVGAHGEDLTWTIPAYDVLGVGTSPPSMVVVTPTSSDTVTRDITVTAQPMRLDFTVSAPGGPVGGAAITFPGGGDITPAAGTASFTLDERAVPLTWTVKAVGYLWSTGSVTTAVRGTIPVPVTLTVRPASVINGTFTSAGAAIVGASVKTCAIVDPAVPPGVGCAPVETFADTDAATGAFSVATVRTGSSRIWVVKGQQNAFVDYTIDGSSNVLTILGSTALTAP